MDKPLAIESHVVFKVVRSNLVHYKYTAVQNKTTETLKMVNSQISLIFSNLTFFLMCNV